MNDQNTTFEEVKTLIRDFSGKRNWAEFHTPKNLAMALSVEVSELMELFQWLTPEESFEIMKSEKTKQAVEDEVADIACYLLALCNVLKIDLSTAIRNKAVKNAIKYPVPKEKN